MRPTAPATRYVPDASAAIKLFVAESLSAEARALFSRLGQDLRARFYVPELFYTEVANALWKQVRRGGMSGRLARQSLSRLKRLALEPVPVADIIDDALHLAIKHEITVYDASYLAVARLVDAPLVTADQRLIEAVGDTKGLVFSLGAFAPDDRE